MRGELAFHLSLPGNPMVLRSPNEYACHAALAQQRADRLRGALG